MIPLHERLEREANDKIREERDRLRAANKELLEVCELASRRLRSLTWGRAISTAIDAAIARAKEE